MDTKEAIRELELMKEYAISTRAKDAIKMVAAALQMQDGNLRMDRANGALHIGVIRGNLYL